MDWCIKEYVKRKRAECKTRIIILMMVANALFVCTIVTHRNSPAVELQCKAKQRTIYSLVQLCGLSACYSLTAINQTCSRAAAADGRSAWRGVAAAGQAAPHIRLHTRGVTCCGLVCCGG